ncbi:MAG: hypothetical protein NVSMB19_03640 [Vulcanimicrobiaceae bacterium]
MFRGIVASAALCAAVVAPAGAAGVTFPSPEGWSHVAVPPPTDPTRTFDQWHIAGDIATVTYIRDGTAAYADSLATILKNFADNNIKPSTNKDVPCQGKTAHVVEFATGPDGKKVVINRMLVPDGTGVVTITYARSDGSAFDNDVKKSETTFCAAAPT